MKIAKFNPIGEDFISAVKMMIHGNGKRVSVVL